LTPEDLEYEGRLPVYHFDVFRLESPREFEDLGVADYWGAGGVCLVEWADRVRGLLPVDTWRIRIEPLEPTRRRVEIDFPAPAADLANQLANGLV
jgi:tRNA threonylcarbamoyladenosine biosynthesis protein TsaE